MSFPTMKFDPVKSKLNPKIHRDRILVLKDKGNSLFKAGNFDLAGVHYSEALELINFEFSYPVDLIFVLQSLVVLLCLNVVACCIKVEDFDSAARMCSLVISVSPMNVKAHYRRENAFKHLGSHEETREDLLKALEVEPHNKDIVRELEAITRVGKGKRKVEADSPKGQASTKALDKAKLVTPVHNREVVAASVSNSFWDEGYESSDNYPEKRQKGSILVKERNTDCISVNLKEVGEAMGAPTPMLVDPCIVQDMVHLEACSVGSFTSHPDEGSGFSGKAELHTPNDTNHIFINRRRRNHNLAIRPSDYEMLVLGKDLGYFHPHSLSYLTSRVVG